MLMAATMGGSGTAAQAIMLRQLLNVAKAVHDMHKASNDLRRARQISHMVRHHLSQVAAALPSTPALAPAVVESEAAEAVCTSTAGQTQGRSAGSVLPPKYAQARTHSTTRGGITRPDIER
jgi:predicted deacylase